MKKIEYYLMRHASYYDHENQYVTYQGMLKLKNSIDNLFDEFTEKFPNKELYILHSALPRAKHTALLIKDMLFQKKMNVVMKSDSRLNSDKLQINEDYIKDAASLCEEENKICLIISHEPDIEHFCMRSLGTAEWIRMSIKVEENITSETNNPDGLPF